MTRKKLSTMLKSNRSEPSPISIAISFLDTKHLKRVNCVLLLNYKKWVQIRLTSKSSTSICSSPSIASLLSRVIKITLWRLVVNSFPITTLSLDQSDFFSLRTFRSQRSASLNLKYVLHYSRLKKPTKQFISAKLKLLFLFD